jgi:soluble lytic murein transglycosylase
MFNKMKTQPLLIRFFISVAKSVLPIIVGLALLLTSCGESIPIPFLASPTPTLSPTPTHTPTPSPTPTLTPTATPTPALPPDEALEAGLVQQRNGDYAAAIATYQSILSSQPEGSLAREALYRLGEVHLLDENYAAAAQALEQFRQQYPEDEWYPFATFRLGTAYDGLGLWDEAIAAYQEYGDQRAVISDYVHLNLGYALMQLERYEEAREEFGQVLNLAPPLTLELQSLRNMALASRHLEEYEAAIGYYRRLLDKAQEDGTRAETLYQMGVTYQEWEDTDQAAQIFAQLANGYPRTYRAYQALEELDALESTAVNDFQRGLIYYYNGLYDPAVLAFYDYIENVEDTAEAHYYAALAYRGYYAHYLTISELETLIEDHSDSTRVGEAWLEIARSWILLDNRESAMGTYRQFFASRPDDSLADDAQWKLANLLEDDGDFEEAIAAYQGLVERFPAGEYAAQALFRVGLNHYRLHRYEDARQVWEGLLQQYGTSDMWSRALFWLGKACLEHEDVEDGLDYLNQLLASDATGYYGLRATDLLRGGPPDYPADMYQQDLYVVDDDAEQVAFEEWLRIWAGGEEGQPLSGLAPRVAQDSLFRKGLELLRVGQRESAKARFREVRTRFQDDPLALYQLALFFQREGFYDQSMACAQRILILSPETSIYNVPRFLQKLHYPVYFADLIVPQAEKRGLEPLLFCALIWQESWYDPFATSSYPARGLTQFIEPTADWVAEELGLTDFEHTDLYRPVVSVEFGGWYLEWIMDYEEGVVFRTLAHYNAGPGNVARWTREGQITDIDLFVEEVDFAQTQAFINRIYSHYWIYRTAYYAN